MQLNTTQNGGTLLEWIFIAVDPDGSQSSTFFSGCNSRLLFELLTMLYYADVKSQYLQTDYTNLKHIREELESALEELNEPYVKRVERNV